MTKSSLPHLIYNPKKELTPSTLVNARLTGRTSALLRSRIAALSAPIDYAATMVVTISQ